MWAITITVSMINLITIMIAITGSLDVADYDNNDREKAGLQFLVFYN